MARRRARLEARLGLGLPNALRLAWDLDYDDTGDRVVGKAPVTAGTCGVGVGEVP